MAKSTNNEELRRQALNTLAEGRAEISAEVRRLKQQLSPARVMHRVVDRHATLVVFIAFAAGIIPALVMFRNKPAPDRKRPPMTVSVTTRPPKSMSAALFTGALGILMKTIGPSLIKSAIMPRRSTNAKTRPQ